MEKLELLAASIGLQNSADNLIQLEDYEDSVLVNDPVDFRPLLLSQWEFDIRPMPHKSALNNYVKGSFKGQADENSVHATERA